MSLLKLPEIHADARLKTVAFDMRTDAVERWTPGVRAATSDDSSISVYDTIGESWDGSGVTAKRIAAALRSIGENPVTVNVNSPGGDFSRAWRFTTCCASTRPKSLFGFLAWPRPLRPSLLWPAMKS